MKWTASTDASIIAPTRAAAETLTAENGMGDIVASAPLVSNPLKL
jgi:hypothetical protein